MLCYRVRRLRYLQEAADASSGAIGGKLSLKEISTAVRLHRAAAVLLREMVPLGSQSPIGRERSSGGNQDGHDVCLGPRPVRDPGRSGLSAVDPSPGWLDPAARYLRAELPRAEVGRGGQDAEEAWAQARVHHRGGQHPAQAAPAPDQRTARHRLTQATPERSRWSLDRRADREAGGPVSLVMQPGRGANRSRSLWH